MPFLAILLAVARRLWLVAWSLAAGGWVAPLLVTGLWPYHNDRKGAAENLEGSGGNAPPGPAWQVRIARDAEREAERDAGGGGRREIS